MPHMYSRRGFNGSRRYYPRFRRHRFVRGHGNYLIPPASIPPQGKKTSWSAPALGYTLGTKAGSSIGSALGEIIAPGGGGFVGGSLGGQIGGWLGNQAGSLFKAITGWGDYTIHSNSLIHKGHIPTFGVGSIRVRHRELIRSVDTSVAFSVDSFPLNPGIDKTFPWLSTIAANYQQYHWNGIVFQFQSRASPAITGTGSNLGRIILATDYNAADPNFEDAPQMMGSLYSNTGAPSDSVLHAIECAPQSQPNKLYFVRTANHSTGTSLLEYDLGKFQLASDTSATAYTAGDLWVTYDITLIKPQNNGELGHVNKTSTTAGLSATTTELFGAAGTYRTEDAVLQVTFDNTHIYFPPYLTSGYFLVTTTYQGTVAQTITHSTWTGSNLVFVQCWPNTTAADQAISRAAPQNSATNTLNMVKMAVVKLTGPNANITFGTPVLPTGACSATFHVEQVNGYTFSTRTTQVGPA